MWWLVNNIQATISVTCFEWFRYKTEVLHLKNYWWNIWQVNSCENLQILFIHRVPIYAQLCVYDAQKSQRTLAFSCQCVPGTHGSLFLPIASECIIYSSWHFHFNKKKRKKLNGFKIKTSWHKAHLIVPFTWKPLIQVGNTKNLASNERYANDSGLICGQWSLPHVTLHDLYMT